MTHALTLALADKEEEALAHRAPRLDALTAQELLRIARIAFRIAQVEALKDRTVIPPEGIRAWADFDRRAQANMCATVLRVVQALVLTGWLEPPT